MEMILDLLPIGKVERDTPGTRRILLTCRQIFIPTECFGLQLELPLLSMALPLPLTQRQISLRKLVASGLLINHSS